MHTSGRTGIIPATVIGALALAAASGGYVWHEISAAPEIQQQNVVTAAQPVVPPPADAPVAITELPAPARHPSSKKFALALDSDIPQASPEPAEVAAIAKVESAVAPAPSIRIEHSHDSNAVNPILLSAWQAYRNGDFDTAWQHYTEVLRKDMQNRNPPTRDALLGMAAIAQQRSQDSIAAEYYSQVLALDPRDPYAHAGMSSLPGAAAGTESRLKLLLAQRPEAAALHFALGNHYAGQSRWGDAQQAYYSACALESDNAQFVFNLAVSLDHLGQRKLAAQHYQRALQLDSLNSGKNNLASASFDRAHTQLRLAELGNP